MAAVYLQSSHVDQAMWLKLNEMRKSGVCCDIELMADDSETRYPAHLCILAAASAFLKQQLHVLDNINRNTLLRMSNFSAHVLEAILDFIYTGSLTLITESIQEIEKAARLLQLAELPQLCKKIIARQRSVPHYDSLLMLQDTAWHRKIQDNLNVFRIEKQFCNVSLQVDEFHTFDAHACLLIAASRYFEFNIPAKKIEEGSIIFLQLKALGITSSALQNALEYIYTGNFSCALQDLGEVEDFAITAKLDNLSDVIVSLRSQTQGMSMTVYDSNEVAQETNMDTGEYIETTNLDHLTSGTTDDITTMDNIASGGDVTTPVFLTQEGDDPDKEGTTEIEITNDQLMKLLKDGVVVGSEGQLEQNTIINAAATGDAGEEGFEVPILNVVKPENVEPGFELPINAQYIDTSKAMLNESQLDMKQLKKEKLYEELPITHAIEFTVNVDGRYECPHCDTSFRKFSEARAHGVKHTDQRPFICLVCNQSFKFKPVLQRHMKLHIGTRPHECGVCGKGFLRLWDMRNHEKTHSAVKPHSCQHCLRSFANQAYLIAHIRNVHRSTTKGEPGDGAAGSGGGGGDREDGSDAAGSETHDCPHCSRSFATLRGLNNHRNVHRNAGVDGSGSRRKFQVACATCGSRFVSSYALHRHSERGACRKNMGMRSYNELELVDGPQQCPQCEATCEDFEALRDHLMSGCIEQMEKPPHYFRNSGHFVCFKCCVTFENFVQFRKHKLSKACDMIYDEDQTNIDGVMETEDGIKYSKDGHKFICVMCDESFTNIKSMRRHIRLGSCQKRVKKKELLGELLCNQCGAQFHGAFALKAHKESGDCNAAEADEIFRCDNCEMVFVNSFALERHTLTTPCGNPKAQDKASASTSGPAICRECGASFVTATTLKRHRERGACEKNRKRPLDRDALLAASTPKVPRVLCSGCGLQFVSREVLRMHKKRGACEKVQKRLSASIAGTVDWSSVSARSIDGNDTDAMDTDANTIELELAEDQDESMNMSDVNMAIVKTEGGGTVIEFEPNETSGNDDGVENAEEETATVADNVHVEKKPKIVHDGTVVEEEDMTPGDGNKTDDEVENDLNAGDDEDGIDGDTQLDPATGDTRQPRQTRSLRTKQPPNTPSKTTKTTDSTTSQSDAPRSLRTRQLPNNPVKVKKTTDKIDNSDQELAAKGDSNTNVPRSLRTRQQPSTPLKVKKITDKTNTPSKTKKTSDNSESDNQRDSYPDDEPMTSQDPHPASSLSQDSNPPNPDSYNPNQDSNNPNQDSNNPNQDSNNPNQDSNNPDSDIRTLSQDSNNPGPGGRVPCEVCGASFTSGKSLARHRARGACDRAAAVRTLRDATDCEGCGERFPGTAALRGHKLGGECRAMAVVDGDLEEGDKGDGDAEGDLKEASAKTDGLIYCSGCGSGFISIEALHIHQSQQNCDDDDDDEEEDGEEEDDEGSTSKNKSASKSKSTTSKTVKKPKKKGVYCSDCGGSFTNNMTLKRHRLKRACEKRLGVAQEETSEPVICEGCGNAFKTETILKKHQTRGACAKIQEKSLTSKE